MILSGAVCEVAATPSGGVTVLTTQEALSAAATGAGDAGLARRSACEEFLPSVSQAAINTTQATNGQETKPSANWGCAQAY